MNVVVITATLGRSPHLDDTIRSVRALGRDLRHIFVCPPEAAARVQAMAPDGIVLTQERADGLYAALNYGLARAPGWDWFTYVNDDDELRSGFEDVMRRHCRPECSRTIAYGDVRFLDARGNDLGRLPRSRNPRCFDALVQAGIPPLFQQGTLMSAAAFHDLGGYDTRFRQVADLDLYVRAVGRGYQLRYYARDVARFRLLPGQLSSDRALARVEAHQMRGNHQAIARVPARKVAAARWRFRLANLDCYWERWRITGLLRTSSLLQRYQNERPTGDA